MKKKTRSVKSAEMNECFGCEGYCRKKYSCGGCGGVYGVGFIGAAVYYISTASGFWMGALGILKALVWPAIVVYKLLGLGV